jgi:hypothetical protein
MSLPVERYVIIIYKRSKFPLFVSFLAGPHIRFSLHFLRISYHLLPSSTLDYVSLPPTLDPSASSSFEEAQASTLAPLCLDVLPLSTAFY